jgi:hypothetical protein
MDDLVDKMVKLGTEPNSAQQWAEVTDGIRSMPMHQVRLLWGAILHRLATDPPAMPRSDITQDQWMAMCLARYQELYRGALVDAGVDGTYLSCGNATGSAGGNVVSSAAGTVDLSRITTGMANLQSSIANVAKSVDLSSIMSQLSDIQSASYKKDIALLAADQLAGTINAELTEVRSRQDQLQGFLANMESNKVSEQETLVRMLKNVASKVDGVVAIAEPLAKAVDAAVSAANAIHKEEPTEVPQASVPEAVPVGNPDKDQPADVAPAVPSARNAKPTEMPEWVEIKTDPGEFAKMKTLLEHHAAYISQRGNINDIKEQFVEDPTNNRRIKAPTYGIGDGWFWLNTTNMNQSKYLISGKILTHILKWNFFGTKLVIDHSALIPNLKKMLKDITDSTSNQQSIKAPLLNFLLNRYSYENSQTKDATNTLRDDIPFVYYNLPFTPGKNGDTYQLDDNVSISAKFAYVFFHGMYPPSEKCPFEKPDGYVDPSTRVSNTASALSAEWDADVWFDTELSKPSKPMADAWFSSIASSISKRSASPSKRSASPSKLNWRSVSPTSPTAATLTSS